MGFFDSLKKMTKGLNSFESVTERAPNAIGVYLMKKNNRVMYVGRAIECRPNQSPSGLRKRLQEHWRGASAGKRELYENRHELTTELKLCDSVEEAKELEGRLIEHYDTISNGWNKRGEN